MVRLGLALYLQSNMGMCLGGVLKFRQPNLPRRITLQVDSGAEQDEQIWLGHERPCDFSADKVLGDVVDTDFALLGHFAESAGEVDEGFAAVVFGDKENFEIWGGWSVGLAH